MSYRKGTRYERRSIQWLEARGYQCIRSAGSHSPFDLVATSDTEVLFIQVKLNRKPTRRELEVIKDWPCPPCARRLIHLWKSYARDPEVIDVSCI